MMLPVEYQEVEYLESTGTQYLISDYHPNPEVNFDITYRFVSYISTDNDQALFGSFAAWSWGRLCAIVYSGRWYVYANNHGCKSNYLSGGTSNKLTRMCSTDSAIEIYVDNALVSKRPYNVTYSHSQASMYGTAVFATTFSNGQIIDIVRETYRLYSLTFSEGDTPMVNLIPCYRKSDEKPGMYDTVRNEFLVNQGTGEDFITGPAVYHHDRISYALNELESRRRALVSILGEDMIFDEIPVNFIQNNYINSNGDAVAYSGWSATGYIDIENVRYLLIKDNKNTYWSALYNANKTCIKALLPIGGTGNFGSGASNSSVILVDTSKLKEGTRYIRFSAANADINNSRYYALTTGKLLIRDIP